MKNTTNRNLVIFSTSEQTEAVSSIRVNAIKIIKVVKYRSNDVKLISSTSRMCYELCKVRKSLNHYPFINREGQCNRKEQTFSIPIMQQSFNQGILEIRQYMPHFEIWLGVRSWRSLCSMGG